MAKWQRHDWKDKKAIYAYMPCERWACVPIAVARAFANNAFDDVEVGVLAGLVHRGMEQGKEGIDRRGRFWGSISELLADTGFSFRYVQVKPTGVLEFRGQRYWPTAATFFRKHPEIEAAFVGTDEHLGYYENGVGFILGARYRVQEVWILKERNGERL